MKLNHYGLQVHRFLKRMKFLFQNNIIRICIRRISMMFKILLHDLISNVACTPNTITNSPKMPTPITSTQLWIFCLKASRCSTFQAFDNITNILRRTVFDVNMYMIFAYNTFKNSYIFRIANLFNKISATFLNVAFKSMVTIFCNSNYVRSKPRYSMSRTSLFFHNSKIQKWVATENLALKVHSFN